MTTEQFLAGVNARLSTLETEIRATPRRGPVLLSTGEKVGHARRLNGTAWDRIDADWRAVSDPVEPVKGEAVAEAA
jgi:hypothetical protein